MATIKINGVIQGTGDGPDNLLKDACGAASAGATVSIVDGDYTTKNEEISIGRNITLEADAANPNTVRIWRISFTSGTLTFSKKTFELFRDANGYASLKMSSGTSLALDSATVDCKRITLLGSNTITLNNSTLSIYEFT